MKHSRQQDLKQIEAFLREWDPIGLGDDVAPGGPAQDEYDSYAPGVYSVLLRGGSERDLAEHLSDIASNQMGLGSSPDAELQMARKIRDWWIARR